jgi:hypothetical protein
MIEMKAPLLEDMASGIIITFLFISIKNVADNEKI